MSQSLIVPWVSLLGEANRYVCGYLTIVRAFKIYVFNIRTTGKGQNAKLNIDNHLIV